MLPAAACCRPWLMHSPHTNHGPAPTPTPTPTSTPTPTAQPSAVDPQHAKLNQKGKQVFLTALVGESVFDDTNTWVDGSQLRSNVAYVLQAGAMVAFGSSEAAGEKFTVNFEEPTGSNPLVEMLMQGAMAGASADVKKAMDGSK